MRTVPVRVVMTGMPRVGRKSRGRAGEYAHDVRMVLSGHWKEAGPKERERDRCGVNAGIDRVHAASTNTVAHPGV